VSGATPDALGPGDRYVAMGSSYAAGPGIRPRSPGSPLLAGRSARNYAHLLAGALDLSLTDVTFSGATAVGMTTSRRGGAAQVDAVTSQTRLVTLTCGGNDVGYLPRLTLSSFPRPLRALPTIRRRVAEFGRLSDERLAGLGATFDRLTGEIRRRAPRADIVLVDYLTILPPDDAQPTGVLPRDIADWGRDVAGRLAEETRAAAERAGCGYVAASVASRDHHAWAPDPWTRRFHYSLRGGAPYHPNLRGMTAVAGLLADVVRPGRL
jgi:lysophospholipase L1-like esterase